MPRSVLWRDINHQHWCEPPLALICQLCARGASPKVLQDGETWAAKGRRGSHPMARGVSSQGMGWGVPAGHTFSSWESCWINLHPATPCSSSEHGPCGALSEPSNFSRHSHLVQGWDLGILMFKIITGCSQILVSPFVLLWASLVYG